MERAAGRARGADYSASWPAQRTALSQNAGGTRDVHCTGQAGSVFAHTLGTRSVNEAVTTPDRACRDSRHHCLQFCYRHASAGRTGGADHSASWPARAESPAPHTARDDCREVARNWEVCDSSRTAAVGPESSVRSASPLTPPGSSSARRLRADAGCTRGADYSASLPASVGRKAPGCRCISTHAVGTTTRDTCPGSWSDQAEKPHLAHALPTDHVLCAS